MRGQDMNRSINRRAGRLLVVDCDYFFPDPRLMPDSTSDQELDLYDWSARETPFNIGPVWNDRAALFFLNDLPLPRCNEGYAEFWGRFDLTKAPDPLLACDSNLYAGKVWPSTFGYPAGAWREVWLYDAHHDCGYHGTDMKEWEAINRFDCSDWMRRHFAGGTELHVRYPRWRADADGVLADYEPHPIIDVDRQVDDDQAVPGPFDAVVVCRSGAWVPSWNDDQFEAFLAAAPLEPLWIDEWAPRNRRFDEQIARAEADGWATT